MVRFLGWVEIAELTLLSQIILISLEAGIIVWMGVLQNNKCKAPSAANSFDQDN